MNTEKQAIESTNDAPDAPSEATRSPLGQDTRLLLWAFLGPWALFPLLFVLLLTLTRLLPSDGSIPFGVVGCALLLSAGGLAIAAAVNVDVTGPQAVVLGLAVFFNFLVSAWITSIVGFALLIAIKGAH